MSRVHGKSAKFSFNSVDLDDELSSITQASTVPEADITAFGDVWQNVLAGKPSHSYEISGSLDIAASQGHKTLIGAIGNGTKTTVFSPDNGTTTFTSTASGAVGSYVSAYKIQLPVGDAAKYNATIQVSNSLIRA